MLRACSKCGRVHDSSYKCNKGRLPQTQEQALRNLSKWHKKSEEIRDKSFNLCAICEDLGEINYLNLEVHHIIKLRDEPRGLLEDSNLICLCSYHHKLADKGEYDIDYLRALANKRDKRDRDTVSLI
jgi:5-methylcytosine-specific restriction endonuclease McrA